MAEHLDAARVFEEICELEADAREAALEAREFAPALRERVRRLLALYDEPSGALDGLAPVPAGAFDLHAGRRCGRYTLLRPLGEGGMGIVYLARADGAEEQVAVKVLRVSLDSSRVRRRFRREAEVLQRLDHPGICRFLEAGEAGGESAPEPYLAMEYVAGATLVEHARGAGLDDAQRVELMARVCDAVHYAHEAGVVHRDLKPSNVLVVPDTGAGVGQPKVLDFGVARAVGEELSTSSATRSGALIGTAAYMSPEQVAGRTGEIAPRSDVYSLGVMLFELLSGDLPYPVLGLPVAMVARAIGEEDPARLSDFVERLRGPLELVLGKALEKDPRRRYASAAALAEDLRRYVRGEPVQARPATVGRQLVKLARRHRMLATGLAAGFLALSIGGGIAGYLAVANGRLARREAQAREDAVAKAEEAQRLKELAEERALELTERADPDRLQVAIERATDLWPALPATVPAIDRWLEERAEPLRANLAQHERSLAELRAAALPYTEADRRRDRAEHPAQSDLPREREQLAVLERRLAGEDPMFPPPTERERGIYAEAIATVRGRIAELESRLDERWTWSFEDPARQRRHDHLARLVAGLRAFLDPEGGTYSQVQGRRATALGIVAATVSGPAAAAEWSAALADIATLPVYDGLELRPQVGLRPLRRDPRSGLWEFWAPTTGERPDLQRSADAGDWWRPQPHCALVFVLLPGGTVQVGAQSTDPEAPHYDPAATNLDPAVQTVELQPYLLSKFEMTQAQWRELTGEQPSTYGPNFTWYGVPAGETPLTANERSNPVESISLEEAERMLARQGFRVPTEAEWEYGARGGTGTPWWTGTTVASLQDAWAANLADARVRSQGGPSHWPYEDELADGWVAHAPAGTFAPNPFGLHEVLGNVWEFCADTPQHGMAVVRGGGYEHGAPDARVTCRDFSQPSSRSRYCGVRPARSLE